MAATEEPAASGEQVDSVKAQMFAMKLKYEREVGINRKKGTDKGDSHGSRFVGVKHALPWNKFNRQLPKPIDLPAISKPSKEESLKRKQWHEDKIKFQERQQRLKDQR